MVFDPTITLGNITSTLVMVGAVIAAYMRLRERLAVVETKVDIWQQALQQGRR